MSSIDLDCVQLMKFMCHWRALEPSPAAEWRVITLAAPYVSVTWSSPFSRPTPIRATGGGEHSGALRITCTTEQSATLCENIRSMSAESVGLDR